MKANINNILGKKQINYASKRNGLIFFLTLFFFLIFNLNFL